MTENVNALLTLLWSMRTEVTSIKLLSYNNMLFQLFFLFLKMHRINVVLLMQLNDLNNAMRESKCIFYEYWIVIAYCRSKNCKYILHLLRSKVHSYSWLHQPICQDYYYNWSAIGINKQWQCVMSFRNYNFFE